LYDPVFAFEGLKNCIQLFMPHNAEFLTLVVQWTWSSGKCLFLLCG